MIENKYCACEKSGFIPSPFSYRDNLNIVFDKLASDNKTSISKYLTDYSNGVFNISDICILKYVYLYGCTTRHTISRLVDSTDELKGSFKKLRNKGLLLKEQLFYESDVSENHKVIDYYRLTSVGYHICKITGKNGRLNLTGQLLNTVGSVPDFNNPIDILKSLSLSNFRAAMDKKYYNFIYKTYNNYITVINKHEMKIPILYQVAIVDKYLLIPISVRKYPGWKISLINTLQLYITALKKTFPYFNLIFIYIVEDNTMGSELAKELDTRPFCKEFFNLFISDFFANKDDVLDNLLSFSSDRGFNKDSFEIVSLKLTEHYSAK